MTQVQEGLLHEVLMKPGDVDLPHRAAHLGFKGAGKVNDALFTRLCTVSTRMGERSWAEGCLWVGGGQWLICTILLTVAVRPATEIPL